MTFNDELRWKTLHQPGLDFGLCKDVPRKSFLVDRGFDVVQECDTPRRNASQPYHSLPSHPIVLERQMNGDVFSVHTTDVSSRSICDSNLGRLQSLHV